ncbi:aminotransferase class IV family protein [Luteimonas vadosa]|uniref:aminotransferase class IV family protein n=1 Tax=Luteimonas vadosa TaxID=1165507 RepID=UPI0031EB07CC
MNGANATAEGIAAILANNYGHFTTMQVRGGAVRGLDLHLQRLEDASMELFGAALPRRRILEALQHASQGTGEDGCTLRVTVASPDLDPGRPRGTCHLDLLVRRAPPAEPGVSPLGLKSFVYQRDLPHLKHVGTFPLFHRRRLAAAAGHDDALLVDREGRVSEGTFWNIGFWHGDAVVWPEAPALRGTCECLLKAGLEALGVAQASRPVALADIAAFEGAFACNSRGVQPVGRIDGLAWAARPGHLELLQEALAKAEWVSIEGGTGSSLGPAAALQ